MKLPQDLEDDLAFIRSFCPRFVPCYVEFDPIKSKHSKVPALKGWTDITPEQSQNMLATKKFEGHRFFLFLTGEATGLFVIDIDRKNKQRQDHADKIDGVEAFEMWCGPVDTPDTFTTRSIGGGYHKVYRLTEDLAKRIKNGQLEDKVLCEILHNKRGFMYGDGCKMIHRMLPQPPPEAVSNLIINNYFNTQVNITNTIVTAPTSLPLSDDVNEALDSDVVWQITREKDESYMLVPATHQCCVETQVQHTKAGHSCVYVRRNAVVLTCFSHGKRLVQGEYSKKLRALFFQYKGTNAHEGVKEIVDELLAVASAEMLARENGTVLKRINLLVPVYEPVSTYEAFLTEKLANNSQLKAFPRRFNDLLVYMARVDDAAFPFVRRDKTYLGFRNGMLNLVSGELEYYGNLPAGVSPRHYINQVCQLDEELKTPLFDQIFRYQLDTGDADELAVVYTYFLGLIGRLFYAVGEFDNFDVMPFVVGDTNTGKSTLVDIVSAMFAPGSVGVVDSSHETIFGLQSMHSKELIVSPEIPDNMAQQLASDKFKKMVCGEIVAVPVKHAVAETVKWHVPMLMCGNDFPRYRDERGSVSKRLAIFSFTRYVPTQDSSLKHRIITEELACLVLKCLRAYRQLLERTGTSGFWTHCPAYFQETTSSMHETTDYVHMFLTLGQGDNVWYDRASNCRKVMYFIQKHGHNLWMEEFKKKFYDYMRFRHPQVKHRWSKDYSAFKRLGYMVDRRHMCRACKQSATRGCCSNYNHANRSHVDVIANIVCVEEYVE